MADTQDFERGFVQRANGAHVANANPKQVVLAFEDFGVGVAGWLALVGDGVDGGGEAVAVVGGELVEFVACAGVDDCVVVWHTGLVLGCGVLVGVVLCVVG